MLKSLFNKVNTITCAADTAPQNMDLKNYLVLVK